MGTLGDVLRQLLRPKALVSHLLVLAVAVTCVLLGLWQLDRLDQVRSNNERLAARMEAEPADLAELMDGEVDPDALEFRPVTVTGEYRVDEEVLQRGQQHQQQQGFHVLTPLEVDGGGVVLVRRGSVPARLSEPPVEEAAPPTGRVEVTGLLEKPVDQPGFGPRDPVEGELEHVFHTDTERLDRQIEGELFTMVLRADAPTDAAFDDLPAGLGPPTLDEANHLSYALQWFTFAALAVITYGAWLWTRHRRSRAGATGDDGDGSPPDADCRDPGSAPIEPYEPADAARPGDAPTGTKDAPMGTGHAPAGTKDAPAGTEDAPAGAGDAPARTVRRIDG